MMKNLELIEMILNFKEEKYNEYVENVEKRGGQSPQAVYSLHEYLSIVQLNRRISNKLEEDCK